MSFTAWGRLALEGDSGEEVTRELLDGGPHRSTWRVRNARGETLVGKVAHPVGRWAGLRRRLLGSPLRREELNLHRAVRRDLPVPFPIAREALADGREVLWLEDLGPVEPLDERFAAAFGSDDADDAARLQLAAEAGQLLRRLLDAGVTHGDLHLGNVVRHRESGTLHVVDLAKARFQDRPVALAANDRRSLFLSFPWPDQKPLRTALADALCEGPLEPTEPLETVLGEFIHRRVARCHRSSGPFVVDGPGRWRRRPSTRATTTHALSADAALAAWEDRFLLEEHGIPVLRAVALDLDAAPGGATLECEDGSDCSPHPTDARPFAAWSARLAASGHVLDADAARLLRDPAGGLRVDGLRLVNRPRRW